MYNKRRLRIFRSVVNKFIHEGIFLMLLDILNFIFFFLGVYIGRDVQCLILFFCNMYLFRVLGENIFCIIFLYIKINIILTSKNKGKFTLLSLVPLCAKLCGFKSEWNELFTLPH